MSAPDPSSPSLIDSITSSAKEAFDDASGALENSAAIRDLKSKIQREMSELQEQASAWKDEKAQMLKEFQEEKKALLVSHMAAKLAAVVSELLLILNIKLKVFLTESDEYMPRFVRSAIKTIIDAVWPTVVSEVHEAIFRTVHLKGAKVHHGDPPEICGCCAIDAKNGCCDCSACCEQACSPFFGIRAWFVYTLEPYDRSFWRCSRDGWWWLLMILSVVPKFGVAQLFYCIYFLLIDRGDEYQLIKFLTSFKSTLFLSLGLLSPLVASGQLFVCVQASPGSPSCSDWGPREEIYTLIIWCVQIILCWVAYAYIIFWSESKGGLFSTLQREQELRKQADAAETSLLEAMAMETVETAYFSTRNDEEEEAAKGRLTKLLVFDSVVFLLCVGLVLWAVFANALDDSASLANGDLSDKTKTFTASENWKFSMVLYYVKSLYGLLNLPWLLLLVPGVSSVFSHARPTGYNRWGVCVPLVGREDPDGDPVPYRRDPPGCCDPGSDSEDEDDGPNTVVSGDVIDPSKQNPLAARDQPQWSPTAADESRDQQHQEMQAQQQQQQIPVETLQVQHPSAAAASGSAQPQW